VASIEEAQTLTVRWNPLAALLAKAFWPGPISLVLPKSPLVPDIVTAGLSTVAIRMPAHSLALKLIQAVKAPLAAPSANKFGKTSPTLAEHVRKALPGVYVVDGGECQVGIESTVVDFPDDGKSEVRILRPGMISRADIESVVGRLGPSIKVIRIEGSAASPGTLKHHYQPRKPLRIIDDRAKINLNPSGEILLGASAAMAARRLYAEIHRLDTDPSVREIYVVRKLLNSGEEWAPIWDRLRRAESGE
jgi:L-threonylcarbamoyladenylate synthase